MADGKDEVALSAVVLNRLPENKPLVFGIDDTRRRKREVDELPPFEDPCDGVGEGGTLNPEVDVGLAVRTRGWPFCIVGEEFDDLFCLSLPIVLNEADLTFSLPVPKL